MNLHTFKPPGKSKWCGTGSRRCCSIQKKMMTLLWFIYAKTLKDNTSGFYTPTSQLLAQKMQLLGSLSVPRLVKMPSCRAQNLPAQPSFLTPWAHWDSLFDASRGSKNHDKRGMCVLQYINKTSSFPFPKQLWDIKSTTQTHCIVFCELQQNLSLSKLSSGLFVRIINLVELGIVDRHQQSLDFEKLKGGLRITPA